MNVQKCNFSRVWLPSSPHPVGVHTPFKALCSQPYRETKRYNLYLPTLELFLWPFIFMPPGKHHWTPPRGGGAVRHAPFSTLLLSLPLEPLTPADTPGLHYSPIQWDLTVFRLDISSSFHGSSVRMMKYIDCEEKRRCVPSPWHVLPASSSWSSAASWAGVCIWIMVIFNRQQ